jgi:ubiquinone/menaquinone biosynthesis C-methylase UbiE
MARKSLSDEPVFQVKCFMSLLTRLAFNLWYFSRPPWDSGISPPELLEFLRDREPGRAIDLGCGTGTNVITLARHGWRVTGVDFALKAINQARKKAKQAEVDIDLRVGDVTHLDGISGPFDLVFDLGCFHSLGDREKEAYLRQIERIMALGATWFLYAFLRSPETDSPPGISSTDLEQISARFTLRKRIDGFERGRRPSAYFIFEKQA